METGIKLPTYLVAIVVSDFEKTTSNKIVGENNTDIPLKTWARPEFVRQQLTNVSQSVGKQAFEIMNNYTGFEYSNGKIDHVALPDFEAGAMENWGLITFRYKLIRWLSL